MMALLHSIANNDDLVIGPGIFKTILEDTKNMSPEERAEYLENCQELAEIHKSSAMEGQTQVILALFFLRSLLTHYRRQILVNN